MCFISIFDKVGLSKFIHTEFDFYEKQNFSSTMT